MGDAARSDVDPHAAETAISTMLRGVDDATVTVTGPLDAAAVARLNHLLKALCAAGARYFVADLAGLSSCDAAARPLFAKLRRKLVLNEGWMLLLDPPPLLADLESVSLEVAFAAYRRVVA